MQDSLAARMFANLREALESRFEIPAASVTPETPLEQLGLDSVEWVELILITGGDVDPGDFSPGTTLGEVVARMTGGAGATAVANSVGSVGAS